MQADPDLHQEHACNTQYYSLSCVLSSLLLEVRCACRVFITYSMRAATIAKWQASMCQNLPGVYPGYQACVTGPPAGGGKNPQHVRQLTFIAIHEHVSGRSQQLRYVNLRSVSDAQCTVV